MEDVAVDKPEEENLEGNQFAEREVVSGVTLVEPVFLGANGIPLGLTKERNPIFYKLATEASRRVQDELNYWSNEGEPLNEEEKARAILGQINSLVRIAAPLEKVYAFRESLRDRLKNSGVINIDVFFKGDPRCFAMCQERSLLAQLIFAIQGYDSELMFMAVKRGEETESHAFLKLDNGLIISTSLGGPRLELFKDEGEFRDHWKSGGVEIINVRPFSEPNVFAVRFGPSMS